MKNLIIFASGGGSNADKIADRVSQEEDIDIVAIVSNKAQAGVKHVAKKHDIPFHYFPNSAFVEGQEVIQFCQRSKADAIILAGFLRKIPNNLIKAFPERILNIHPALLPKYGGKGMYGRNVHQAVEQSEDQVSGPTIHLVNQEYDKGRILFQAEVEILNSDNAEDIASKVLSLEHQYYGPVAISYIRGLDHAIS